MSRIQAGMWALIVPIGLAQEPAPAPKPEAKPKAQSGAQALEALMGLSQGEAVFDPTLAGDVKVQRVKTGHLLVRPVINDKDAGWFIFDTGAGICVVSTSHVEPLGLAGAGDIDALGVGGGESAQLFRVSSLALGPLTLKDHPVMTTDLSFLEQHLGEEIAGVIGYGVLSRCVAEIDLKTPRISLHDSRSYALEGSEWTPMSITERIPSVTATFEGREGRFRLDTGANTAVTFHEPAVRKWGLLEGREVSDAKLGGVGGFVNAKRGKLESFELCGMRREGLQADFALEAKGSFANDSLDGNIGAGFLGDFVLVVDYSGERFTLRNP